MLKISELSDIMPDLFFWQKDLNSKYLEADKKLLKMLGFATKADFYGLSDYEIDTFSKMADLFLEEDKFVINKKDKSTSQFLTIVKYPQNNWIIALITKKTMRDCNDKVTGTFGYGQNLTHLYAKNYQRLVNNQRISENTYFIWDNFTIFNEDIKLTPRQTECLFLLLRGMPSKRIAQILALSVRTIEEFIEQLRQKFSCNTKFQLLEKAIEFGYMNFIPVRFLNYSSHIL